MRAPRAAIVAITAGFCAGFFVPAHALELPDIAPDRTWVLLFSRHWDGGEYNETNIGIGLQYDLTPDWAIEPGAYWNSHKRPSRYVWLSWRFAHGARWELRAAGGIVDRYHGKKMENGEASPIAALLAEYYWGRAITLPGVTAASVKAHGD